MSGAKDADEEQTQWRDEAKEVVKQQAFFMKRALDDNNLRDALKHSSNMLSELRTSLLSPKNYYELYMHVFDELRHLESFFMEEHKKGRRMLELYELVQHAGNILPRLYLLITVGSVYIKSKEAPAKDILKDLVEMCRGVQHPMRGLFLRNYLSSMSKDKLPDQDSEYEGWGGDVSDSVDFILINFTEMNKLWVRMQHQGPIRERHTREKERSDLRILVGTNLVRLSQLEGVDFAKYKEVVLPRILEQVVNCKDEISQRYLMECIIQVFPDEFHLQTLEMFLDHCTQLQSSVNVKAIVIALMDRLASYSAQNTGGIPEDVKVFSLFTQYVVKLIQAHPAMELADILQLQVSLINFALQSYPDRLDYVDHVLAFCTQLLGKIQQDRLTPAVIKLLVELLTLPLDAYKNIKTVLQLQNYSSLMNFLEWQKRKDVSVAIVKNVLEYQTQITEVEEVDQLLETIGPLVRDDDDAEEVAEEEYDEDFEEEQILVSRLVHFLKHENIFMQFKMYATARKHFGHGGPKRIKHTLIPLVFGCLQLTPKVKAMEDDVEEEGGKSKLAEVFMFIHKTVQALKDHPEQALRLFLACAQAGDMCQNEAITYEFMERSFEVYEDDLTDSKAQFAAISLTIGTIQSLTSLGEENYESLISRTTKYSAKLLKKNDQCRAVYKCSHLFWVGDGEDDERSVGVFHDGKKVLECLQKALKIADGCKVSNMHVQLFVEILNEYLYYFEKKSMNTIQHKMIRSLIALIDEHLSGADMSETMSDVQTHYQNTRAHILFKKSEDEEGRELYAEIDVE